MENYLQKNYSDECHDFTHQLFNHLMESLQEILIQDKFLIFYHIYIFQCCGVHSYRDFHRLSSSDEPFNVTILSSQLCLKWVRICILFRFPQHVVFQIQMTTSSHLTPTVRKIPPLSTLTCIRSGQEIFILLFKIAQQGCFTILQHRLHQQMVIIVPLIVVSLFIQVCSIIIAMTSHKK